ncbi:MAG: Rrf2 family transcriptional regulator [Chloroflexi bacterium]|nr:Rrf2 family transcriptional regulator [Chloroflexota bacterium]
MKVSMKSDYSLRAVLDLAGRFGKGPIQSADIAARQGIPEAYLEQLLTHLRKAGLIQSVRGPQGGHLLARPPEQISVGDVIDALEGSVAPLQCVETSSACSLSGACAQRELWKEIDEMTHRVLNSTTIASLLEREAAHQRKAMFYI